MKDQRAGAKAPAAPQPAALPPQQARSTGPGPSAAAHQSAELLTSMGLPTGDPGVTDPVAAQSDDVRGAYPTDPGPGSDGAVSGMPPAASAMPGSSGVHTVVAGQDLGTIAQAVYGDAILGPAIARANPGTVGDDGDTVEPGVVLHVPDLDTILATSSDQAVMQAAFGRRWGVDVGHEEGTEPIGPETLRRIHAQLQLLPPEDAQGTWTRLLHQDNRDGASMGYDGTFKLGEHVVETDTQRYGQFGAQLTTDARAGATSIAVGAIEGLPIGAVVAIGDEPTRDSVTIEGLDADTLTFSPPLANDHSTGTPIRIEPRDVSWLEAVVRHEIGHAVDLTQVDTTGLTQGLAEWTETDDVGEWLAPLGDAAWTTADGEHVDAPTRALLTEVLYLVAEKAYDEALSYGAGEDGRPVYERYASRGLPALQAVKPMAERGEQYYRETGDLYRAGGFVYAPAPRAGKLYRYREIVADNQVRQYQLHAPAEFFAELYTVYYEEAADPSAEPGRLIPVSSWKSWMDDNVAARNRDPTTVMEEGAPSPTRGMPAGE